MVGMELGDFIGAGILPYCIDEHGKVKFFLGKELSKSPTLAGRNKYCWSDFGGRREGENETAEGTACREFSEETLGLWGGIGPLDQRIKQSIQILQDQMSDTSLDIPQTECAVRHGEENAAAAPPEHEAQNHLKGNASPQWTALSPQPTSLRSQTAGRRFILKNGLYINFVVRVPYIDPLLFLLARDENDRILAACATGFIKQYQHSQEASALDANRPEILRDDGTVDEASSLHGPSAAEEELEMQDVSDNDDDKHSDPEVLAHRPQSAATQNADDESVQVGSEEHERSLRSAEKRDWTWVDSDSMIEGLDRGGCVVTDSEGQRLHLLPRLAVTLRAHLRFMMDHLGCSQGCDLCNKLLEVPLDRENRCLHLFGVRSELSNQKIASMFQAEMAQAAMASGGSEEAQESESRRAERENQASAVQDRQNGVPDDSTDEKVANGPVEQLERVMMYKDRIGKTNAFVLFVDQETALQAKRLVQSPSTSHSKGRNIKAPTGFNDLGFQLKEKNLHPEIEAILTLCSTSEMEKQLWGVLQGVPEGERVQFAWFEYGLQDSTLCGTDVTQKKRKRDVSRRRKLGIGNPTAPWANGKRRSAEC